jgi:hypothetical protein
MVFSLTNNHLIMSLLQEEGGAEDAKEASKADAGEGQ